MIGDNKIPFLFILQDEIIVTNLSVSDWSIYNKGGVSKSRGLFPHCMSEESDLTAQNGGLFK